MKAPLSTTSQAVFLVPCADVSSRKISSACAGTVQPLGEPASKTKVVRRTAVMAVNVAVSNSCSLMLIQADSNACQQWLFMIDNGQL